MGSSGALRQLVARLSMASEFIANIALFLMTLGITADVFYRWLAGVSSKSVVELTGYLMVAVVFFGLAPAQRARAHIKVDIFLNMFPKAVKRAIEWLTQVMFIVYSVILCYLGWDSVTTSYMFKTTSRTGLDVLVWPFQLFIPIGLALLIVVLISEMIDKPGVGTDGSGAALVHD